MRATVLLIGLALVLHAGLYLPYVVDDAYISFRYARNLIQGHGLVFNPGEPVEGYTNFLWTLLIAAALGLGAEPRAAAQALGLLFGLAALWGAARLARQLAPDRGRRYLALPPLLLAACGAFAFWCVAGLETAAFAALLAWASVFWLQARAGGSYVPAALMGAGAALERPEGLLFFGVAAGIELIDRLRGSARGRAAPAALFSFLLIAALHFGWRWWTYGQLLPNPFYAKVELGPDRLWRGLEYLAGFGRLFPLFAFAALALIPRRDPKRRFDRAGALRLMVVALVYLFYVAAVGGDAMPLGRFVVPVLPLMAPLLAEVADRAGSFLAGLARIRQRSVLRLAAGAAALLSLLAPSLIGAHWINLVVAKRVTDLGLACGRYLRSQLPPDTLLATNTAGALPYASEFPTIDMLGINDLHIARRQGPGPTRGWIGHERGDGAYVLRRLPDLIVFGNSTGSVQPFYRSDHELATAPQFARLYRIREVASAELLPEGPFRLLKWIPGEPGGGANPFEMVFDVGVMIQRFASAALPATRLYAHPWKFTFYQLNSGARTGPGDAAPQQPTAAERRRALELCEQARLQLDRNPNPEPAQRLLWQAARLDPQLALPFQYLSNLHFLHGDLDRAIWAVWRALEREPHNQLYLRNLAALREKRKTGTG
ncbi:MAG TPA: hypothetical protein VGB99_12715 [Acidobacteriota bacterium]